MNRPTGFSTGAICQGDFRHALELLRPHQLPAVELSSLRENELEPLLAIMDTLDLSGYSYVSVHAPSAFVDLTEKDVATLLKSVLGREWPIIVHPDILTDVGDWGSFGEWLCIENMDKRKSTGRTLAELEKVFSHFSQASFCFDIGHARQIDPTMSEAALMLRRFEDRLRQVHLSEVSSSSRHEAISLTALNSFRKVAHLIPEDIPIILETPVTESHEIEEQVPLSGKALQPSNHALSALHSSNGTPRKNHEVEASSTAES